jgi:hypothetical protein
LVIIFRFFFVGAKLQKLLIPGKFFSVFLRISFSLPEILARHAAAGPALPYGREAAFRRAETPLR